jgi:hypothetical protein
MSKMWRRRLYSSKSRGRGRERERESGLNVVILDT